ncbi:unnamed protein product [Cuscuta epithymum]|uniref:Uncharacterized protein n=1 Tax=Cuscuta epithymum TaxID=186058 RepID=A0AAV0F2X5_9ASTE|nr:unnamed protein product [Cuscuta epithymum]
MSNILQAPDDVAMLRARGVIKGKLDDVEVVEIFNGIGKSVGNLKPKECASRKVVKQVKEMVEECVEEIVEVCGEEGYEWCRVDKEACAMGIGLKGLLYLFMDMLLVLQIMQAFCQVYGCNKGGSEAKAMSSLCEGSVWLDIMAFLCGYYCIISRSSYSVFVMF